MLKLARAAAFALIAAALHGCTAMRDPYERTYQTVHALDAIQTASYRDDPCIEEANPITRGLIGREPSTGAVIAWWAGTALAHAGVTEWLLDHDHPRMARAWNWITITDTGIQLVRGHRLGARIIGPNERPCLP